MSKFFKAKTRTGQTLIYCIAGGERGRQAMQDLKRDCEICDIVEVSPDDLQVKASANGAARASLPDTAANDRGPERDRRRGTGR